MTSLFFWKPVVGKFVCFAPYLTVTTRHVNNRGRRVRDAPQRFENPITVGNLESLLGIFSNFYDQICEFYSLRILGF